MLTKSNFEERPGVKPAIPGLQGIGLSSTPRKHLTMFLFCLFDLILYVQVNNLSVLLGPVSLG